ncbi:MAG TPA: TolC family protein [Thermoanaerobaculia bacterium]|nr:TolC family protein [Thermoanaerobaculia bacterium]
MIAPLMLLALVASAPQAPPPAPAPAVPAAPATATAPTPRVGEPAAAAPARPLLTLEQALATARDHQPQVAAAAAATAAAAARSDEARSSLLPQVNGNGSYQRATANFVSRPGALPRQLSSGSGSESWDNFGYYNLGLSANYLLYDFGQTKNRWRSAEASLAAQRESERTTANQVLFAVRTAFFSARAARELVKVAEDTLGNQKKHLDQTQGFVDVGTQPPIALAQAKTAVANAQVQLINSENSYETALAQLNQAMGVEGPTDYDVADEPEAPLPSEDGTADTLFDEALRARPELATLADQVRAQELTVRALKSANLPSVGLSTGLSDAGGQVGNLTWNWNAAVQFSVPIFLGGLTKAQVAEGEANLAAARSQLQIERLQVRLEVDQGRLAVRAAKAALAASADALDNAKEQLNLAEGRFETGVGSIIELGDAQVALTSAAQQRVQAIYNLSQARVQLLKALGRG